MTLRSTLNPTDLTQATISQLVCCVQSGEVFQEQHSHNFPPWTTRPDPSTAAPSQFQNPQESNSNLDHGFCIASSPASGLCASVIFPQSLVGGGTGRVPR